jgi:hypothetical protein
MRTRTKPIPSPTTGNISSRAVYKLTSSLLCVRHDFLIIFIDILSGVRLSPLGTAATTGLLYQPQMIDDGDCGAIGGMEIGRANGSTRRKSVPEPLCPPQIRHD